MNDPRFPTFCWHVFTSARDDLSPAVTVWPNSIKASILCEWLAAFLQDEVGIPVQTLFAVNRHAHHTAVTFSIHFVTVVWPSRGKESNDMWILRVRCVFRAVSGSAVMWRSYLLRRSFRCSLQGRNTGSWSVWDPSCKCPHFDKDQACREKLRPEMIKEYMRWLWRT